jgi:transcriptional antiterminator
MNKNIIIFSDSQAAIKALQACHVNSRTVLESIEKLNSLARNNTVNIIWVPAHIGITGNERADRMANESIDRNEVERVTYIPWSHIDSILEAMEREESNNLWRKNQKCRHSKLFIGNRSKKLRERLFKLNKSDLRIVIKIITGHCATSLMPPA